MYKAPLKVTLLFLSVYKATAQRISCCCFKAKLKFGWEACKQGNVRKMTQLEFDFTIYAPLFFLCLGNYSGIFIP